MKVTDILKNAAYLWINQFLNIINWNFKYSQYYVTDKLNILATGNPINLNCRLKNEKSTNVSELSLVSNHKHYSFQRNF